MNPVSYETTLDPEQRILLQVTIDQEDDADNAFSTLMIKRLKNAGTLFRKMRWWPILMSDCRVVAGCRQFSLLW